MPDTDKKRPGINIHIPLLDVSEVGYVKDVRGGVARVTGLPSCIYGQFVEFSRGTRGLVTGFDTQDVLIIILGDESTIFVGDSVSSLSALVGISVGEKFLGRIVNSIGEPIDGLGEIRPSAFFPIFRPAPGVMEREPINEALHTGIKIIDLLIPIGKGQRELIIGDRQSGKSSIGIDTIINQKDKDVICIYCWVGGPKVALKKIISTLNQKEAMKHTIIVAAPAGSAAAEQYMAPYTAATLGEYFMLNGKDVLIIFDDLTKHAWIYRQMSLLLERSPGREAYPGDIFYLHSQLMERAGRLKKELGGGSMTFLPIVETLQGDITGYIQTNLISITDGQIYIGSSIFREGFKPAIDLGLSVSRIGSKVQSSAIKEVSQGLRLEYAQYRETLRLTKLRTRLSTEAMEKMRRGDALRSLLMQLNGHPVSETEEIILFYAFKRKILEVVPPHILEKFIAEFYRTLQRERPQTVAALEARKELTVDVRNDLDKAFVDFFKTVENDNAKES